MDAPNAPNPNNPNAQNPVDQNQDQNQDQDQIQDQVPIGQVPAHVPVPTGTTTNPCATGPCWCSPDILSKLDR